MTEDEVLRQFSEEMEKVTHERSRSICEYCGCNHAIRIRTKVQAIY